MNATVSQTILNQLGGTQFILCTGAKKFLVSETSLSMQIGSNAKKISHVKVELNDDDTYTMKAFSIRKGAAPVAESTDIYCDMLQDEFERLTGLFVTLRAR